MGFDSVKCLLCNKDMPVVISMTTFFTDKEGIKRHGSICIDCYWTHKMEEE